MGNLSELIEKRFGVKTRAVVSSIVSLAALGQLVLNANPDRLALIIVNMSANDIYLAFDTQVTTTRGVFLAKGGGSMSLTVEEDFELVGYAIYGASAAYPSAIFAVEIEAE